MREVRLRAVLVVPVLVLVLGACGAARGATASRACVEGEPDPAWLATGPVSRGCDVDEPARLLSDRVTVDYRPVIREPCFSALIEFVVGLDGTPEAGTARLVRTTNHDFARAALATVPALRYRPARRAGSAVRQVVRWGPVMALTVTVGSDPSVPPRRLPGSCRA